MRREICGDAEGKILFEAIPALRDIMACKEPHTSEEEKKAAEHVEDDNFTESRLHRLNYLLKKFVNIISNMGDPVVLLVDDLQVS